MGPATGHLRPDRRNGRRGGARWIARDLGRQWPELPSEFVMRPVSARSCPKGTLTFLASPGTPGARSIRRPPSRQGRQSSMRWTCVGPVREPLPGGRCATTTSHRTRPKWRPPSFRAMTVNIWIAPLTGRPHHANCCAAAIKCRSVQTVSRSIATSMRTRTSSIGITRDEKPSRGITDTPILKMGSSPDGRPGDGDVPLRKRLRPESPGQVQTAAIPVQGGARRKICTLNCWAFRSPDGGSSGSHSGRDKPRPLAPPTCSFRCPPDYPCQTCPMGESRQSTTP